MIVKLERWNEKYLADIYGDLLAIQRAGDVYKLTKPVHITIDADSITVLSGDGINYTEKKGDTA